MCQEESKANPSVSGLQSFLILVCSLGDFSEHRVESSPLFFVLVCSPRDFSDKLPNKGLGAKAFCISGMPISTIHYCSDQ